MMPNKIEAVTLHKKIIKNGEGNIRYNGKPRILNKGVNISAKYPGKQATFHTIKVVSVTALSVRTLRKTG